MSQDDSGLEAKNN